MLMLAPEKALSDCGGSSVLLLSGVAFTFATAFGLVSAAAFPFATAFGSAAAFPFVTAFGLVSVAVTSVVTAFGDVFCALALALVPALGAAAALASVAGSSACLLRGGACLCFDLKAGLGDAGGVGPRQIAAIGHRFGRTDLQLTGTGEFVIAQRGVAQVRGIGHGALQN